jgi:RNA polymerase sigma-70 factor (ECF subfamily)
MDERSPSLTVEDLFKKYRHMMYALALSLSRNASDAEDILQNSFLQIYKNLSSFKGNSRISTWIYRITYNEAMIYLRKRYRDYKIYSGLKERSGRDLSWLSVNWAKLPDKELLNEELKERVEGAIKDMPIKYRMPLLLHSVEKLPVKEAAHVLGLQENSLKTRLHRAHLMVKKELSGYFRDKMAPVARENKKCGIWNRFVYEYVSGELDKKEQADFQGHIDDCPRCKAFLNTYQQAIRITKAIECKDIPPELQERIEGFVTRIGA